MSIEISGPQVSGVKQKNPKSERERIRSLLLPEEERLEQDTTRPKSMTPEKHTINSQNVVFVGASHIFNAEEEERTKLKSQLGAALQDFSNENQDRDVIYILEGQFPGDDKIEDYIQETPDDEKPITIKAARDEKAAREKTGGTAKVEYVSGDPKLATLYEMMKESPEFSSLKSINIEGFGDFNKGDLAFIYFFFRDCNIENGLNQKNTVAIFNIVNSFGDFSFFDTSNLKQILDAYPGSISKEDLQMQAMPIVENIISKLKLVKNYFESAFPDQTIKNIIEEYDPSEESEATPNLRSTIHSVATVVRRERDVYLLEQIQEQTLAGKSTIVVWGASHQTRTRPVLEAMSKKE